MLLSGFKKHQREIGLTLPNLTFERNATPCGSIQVSGTSDRSDGTVECISRISDLASITHGRLRSLRNRKKSYVKEQRVAANALVCLA
jgi:hypothetical protein